MVCQKNGSYGPALDVLTILHQADECVSEGIPTIVTECLDISQIAENHGEQRTSSGLPGLIASTSIESNILKTLQKRCRLRRCLLQKKKKIHREWWIL